MPASDPGAARQFYARWARLYDLLARAPGVRSWRVRTADALALEAGDTVVEMGCGTGANFPYLRGQVGPDGRVVGVDLTPGMLEVARDRVVQAGWENVSVLVGDATRPPVSEADAVVATFLVGMLGDSAAAVERWCDALRPGGRLVLLNASPSTHPAAAPLNLLFRGFVRAAAPGDRTARQSPAEELERRVDAARDALAARADSHEERRLGLGYVRLVSGRL
ncbi:MAG: ubiquinone/menaquinone biosynthesis C-methylase UbiE [Salinirussus sp.]|jgi:ubiquinone/menaquinone biosynthesis C-methylase UbiE